MPTACLKELREDVVAVARAGGDTLAQIAKNLGIADSCVRIWLRAADRRRHPRHGPDVLVWDGDLRAE